MLSSHLKHLLTAPDIVPYRSTLCAVSNRYLTAHTVHGYQNEVVKQRGRYENDLQCCYEIR
jgi:hypothetical protein